MTDNRAQHYASDFDATALLDLADKALARSRMLRTGATVGSIGSIDWNAARDFEQFAAYAARIVRLGVGE